MSDIEPIVSSLPDKQTAFVNKYRDFSPYLVNVPSPIRRSLMRIDLERINRGQNPLSVRESVQGIMAAVQGEEFTEDRDASPLDYFKLNLDNPILKDITTIGSSIPHLPGALIDEVRALPQLPQYAAQAVATADDPLQAIGNLATAPGLQFAPGAYLLENLLEGQRRDLETGQVISTGSPGQLLEHPVFTTLDVLPVARGAAGAVPSVQAARALALPGQKVPLLSTALGYGVGESGKLVPSRLNLATTPARDAIRRSPVGRGINAGFGKYGRETSAVRAMFQREAEERAVPTTSFMGKKRDPRTFDDEFTAFARDTKAFRHPEIYEEYKRFADIHPDRRRELTRMMERDPSSLSTLAGLEREWVDKARELADYQGRFNVSQGELVEVDMGGPTPELLPRAQGIKILADQRRVARLEDLNRSYRIANSTDEITPDMVAPIFDDMAVKFREGDLTTNQRIKQAEADLYALRAAGYDTTEALKLVREVRQKKAPIGDLQVALDKVTKTRATKPPVDIQAMLEEIIPEATTRTDATSRTLHRSIKKGEYKAARQAIRKLRARNLTDEQRATLSSIYDEIVELDRAKKWSRRNKSEFGDRYVQTQKRQLDKMQRRTVPGKYAPLVQEGIKTRLKELAEERVAEGAVTTSAGPISPTSRWTRVGDDILERDLTPDEISQLIDEGNLELIPSSVIDEADVRQIQREVSKTWQDMRDALGEPPVFVHHVKRDAANINSPIVLEKINDPTQVKRRTLDFSPYVEDASVALNHAAMEWLGKQGSEAFFKEMVTRVGKDELTLRNDLRPVAIRNVGNNPEAVRAEIERLIKLDWEALDPGKFMPWVNNFSQFPKGYMIPIAASDTIKRMHVPPAGRISQTLDPGMRLFRTAVLPLSPRWHIYNILGGGIMATMRLGPAAIMRHAREAWAMTSNADALPREMSRGVGSMPRDAIDWGKKPKLEKQQALADGFHYSAGQKIRQIWEQAVAPKFNSLLEASYDLNGKFDDFYRSIAYLDGQDKALLKGMNKQQAQEAGIQTARKIMQDWDQLTPIERQVMRYIFPFYGWMQHILRYTFSYPIDHPIRAEIISKFAMNELRDMDSGLPEAFSNLFMVGNPDENGRIRAINSSGFNPFADVANTFTLAGFAGNAGPYIGSILQLFGVDPVSGGPSLYPDLKYDPQSGRLVAESGNPVSTIIGNFLPQTRMLMNLTVNNAEWKDQLRRNPDAASRQIASSFGFPTISRTINLHEEQIDAELGRDDAQAAARREALRTGNFSEAYRYPGLVALLDQIKVLEAQGALQRYRPFTNPAVGPGILSSFATTNPLRAITGSAYDEQIRQLESQMFG